MFWSDSFLLPPETSKHWRVKFEHICCKCIAHKSVFVILGRTSYSFLTVHTWLWLVRYLVCYFCVCLDRYASSAYWWHCFGNKESQRQGRFTVRSCSHNTSWRVTQHMPHSGGRYERFTVDFLTLLRVPWFRRKSGAIRAHWIKSLHSLSV